MMRQLFVATLMVLMVAAICLVSADSQKIPDLVGNWTGTYVGHEREGGYDSPPEWILLLTVTEQRERSFNGTISYQKKSEDTISGTEGFSGAIGSDLKSVYLGEYDSGIAIGQILDPDTIEFIYIDDGKNGAAVIDTFTRDKS